MADREHSPEERLLSFNEMCRWRAWRDPARIHPRPFGKELPPEALIEIVPLLKDLAAGRLVARRDGEIVPTRYWTRVLAEAERAEFQDTYNPFGPPRLMMLATTWAHGVLILEEIGAPSLHTPEPPKPEPAEPAPAEPEPGKPGPGKPPEPVETALRSEQLPELSPERERSPEPESEQLLGPEKPSEPEAQPMPPPETAEPEAQQPEIAKPEAEQVPDEEEGDLSLVKRLMRDVQKNEQLMCDVRRRWSGEGPDLTYDEMENILRNDHSDLRARKGSLKSSLERAVRNLRNEDEAQRRRASPDSPSDSPSTPDNPSRSPSDGPSTLGNDPSDAPF
jgi:hypothetical protein